MEEKVDKKKSIKQLDPSQDLLRMVFRKRILFIGDDLYFCWTDKEFSGEYNFFEMFDARLHQIYGVADGTIPLWTKYINMEVPKYEYPKYIFVSLGENDLIDTDYDVYEVLGSLMDFVKLLKKKYKGVEIYLSTLIHYPFNIKHRDEEIEFNNWILNHANEYKYNVIDSANIIEKRINEKNIDEIFYHDYNHLGPLGYKLMAKGLEDIKQYNLLEDELFEGQEDKENGDANDKTITL